MSKRVIIIFLFILCILPTDVWSWSTIYDDVRELLYVGGSVYYATIRKYNDIGIADDNEYKYLEKAVYRINLKDGTKRILIKDKFIYGIDVSMKGYVAIAACRPKKDKNNCNLVLFNSNGEKIKEIEHIPASQYKIFFEWSPDGTKIAYLKGTSNENRPHIAYRSHVWIYDVISNETSEIKKDCMDINWEEYDGNIYMRLNERKTDVIYIFNPITREGRYKELKGMWFSHDGQYYLGTKSYQGVEMDEEDYYIYKSNDASIHYDFNHIYRTYESVTAPEWLYAINFSFFSQR